MSLSNLSKRCYFPDADSFEPEAPIKNAAVLDKWEGEDEDDDVKVSNGCLFVVHK